MKRTARTATIFTLIVTLLMAAMVFSAAKADPFVEAPTVAAAFLQSWENLDFETMVSLCDRDWLEGIDSEVEPSAELLALCGGSQPLDFIQVSSVSLIPGRYEKVSFWVKMYHADAMIQEDSVDLLLTWDEEQIAWRVDPRSLTGEAFAAVDEALASMTLYWNPDGGTRYHADPNCASISSRYLPLTDSFTYSQLTEEAYLNLTPCHHCGAPDRPAE